MEVVRAESAGFCFGVEKAMEKAYRQIEKKAKDQDKIYTFGPLIHNEEVVKELKQKGVEVIDSVEELKEIKEGSVIIRSHGVSREIYHILEERGVECIDATCPFVKRIHKIVEKESEQGKKIIIIGNDGHPEVEGIKGWCHSPAIVIESKEDALNFTFEEGEKLCIVSQTTFNYNKFQELVEKISRTSYDINVLNTICNATQERQVEAKKIASQVDVMLVIGGKHSSNTQKLYEICQKECKNTYYIQTIGDLNPECISSACNVGITAGASTPNNIIEEVHTNVRVKF